MGLGSAPLEMAAVASAALAEGRPPADALLALQVGFELCRLNPPTPKFSSVGYSWNSSL